MTDAKTALKLKYKIGEAFSFEQVEEICKLDDRLADAEARAAQWKENANMIAAEAEQWKAKAEAAEEKAGMLAVAFRALLDHPNWAVRAAAEAATKTKSTK